MSVFVMRTRLDTYVTISLVSLRLFGLLLQSSVIYWVFCSVSACFQCEISYCRTLCKYGGGGGVESIMESIMETIHMRPTFVHQPCSGMRVWGVGFIFRLLSISVMFLYFCCNFLLYLFLRIIITLES